MADIASNLDLWWKLDDNTGTSATDASGNSRAGTLNSSPTWTAPGKIGASALTFSGTNNVTRASFQFANDWSICFWHKAANAYNSGTDTILLELISGGTLIQFRKYSDNGFYCGMYDGGEYRVNVAATAQTWPQNTWAHYALTSVRNSVTTLYADAVSIGTKATTPTIGSGTLFVGSGASSTSGTTGLIDDVRIYSRGLTGTEVLGVASWPGTAPLAAHYGRLRAA